MEHSQDKFEHLTGLNSLMTDLREMKTLIC